MPLKFNAINNEEERASATFFDDGKLNSDHNQVWPDLLDTDLFDNIWIKRVDDGSGKPLKITRIRVVLNNIEICDQGFMPYMKVLDKTNICEYIRRHRLSYINNINNSILHSAALEIGKSWSPKYGGLWQYIIPPGGSKEWLKQPENWCTEFFDWILRKNGYIGGTESKIHQHRKMVCWFRRYSEFLAPNISDSPDYCRIPLSNGIYVAPPKEKRITWDYLWDSIQPGYYSRVKSWRSGPIGPEDDRRDCDDGDYMGHSTIFISWCDIYGNPISVPNNSTHYFFLGLGGNQSESHWTDFGRVCIKIFDIVNYWPPNKSPDIVWRRKAKDPCGMYDGFGVI